MDLEQSSPQRYPGTNRTRARLDGRAMGKYDDACLSQRICSACLRSRCGGVPARSPFVRERSAAPARAVYHPRMILDPAEIASRAARPLEEKERDLRALVGGFDRVLVAFSGGVDSSLLLKVAVDELGPRARAVMAEGPSLPERDRADARRVAAQLGVELTVVETNEFEDDRYLRNASDRCYWCRSALVDALAPLAEREGAALLYGPVADDLDEERPGMEAAARGGFRAPLLESGFTKDDVRQLARALGLPIWDKPSSACLASRVPTGTPIDAGRLARIDRAETGLRALGFRVVRVRDHGDLARLELGPDEIGKIADAGLRARVVGDVLSAGFRRVAVDLEGYRPAGLKTLPRL